MGYIVFIATSQLIIMACVISITIDISKITNKITKGEVK